MGWWGLTFLSADHVPGRGLYALFELSPLNLTVGSWCSDYSHFTCAEKWGVELLSSGPSVTELRKDSKICPHTGLLNTAPLPLDHYTSLERSLEADYVRGVSHLRRPPSSPQDLLVMKLLFLAFTHRGLLWACLYHSVCLGVEWGLRAHLLRLYGRSESQAGICEIVREEVIREDLEEDSTLQTWIKCAHVEIGKLRVKLHPEVLLWLEVVHLSWELMRNFGGGWT